MLRFNKAVCIIIITIVLSVALYYTLSSDVVHHSKVTSGYVITKQNDNDIKYYINFLTLSEQRKPEEVKIEIKDKNIWNLIEEDNTYFVNYEWTNNNIPVLNQIEINEKFKDLYDKNLKRKQ